MPDSPGSGKNEPQALSRLRTRRALRIREWSGSGQGGGGRRERFGACRVSCQWDSRIPGAFHSSGLTKDAEPRSVQGHARRSSTVLHAEGPARMTGRCASIAVRASGPGPGRYGSARLIAKLSQRHSAPRRAQCTRSLLEVTETSDSVETVPLFRSAYTSRFIVGHDPILPGCIAIQGAYHGRACPMLRPFKEF